MEWKALELTISLYRKLRKSDVKLTAGSPQSHAVFLENESVKYLSDSYGFRNKLSFYRVRVVAMAAN